MLSNEGVEKLRRLYAWAENSRKSKEEGRRRIEHFLGRTEIADYRQGLVKKSTTEIHSFTRRARAVDAHNLFPELGKGKQLIIKVEHIREAEETIRRIRGMVARHNLLYRLIPKKYVLRQMDAHAIGPGLIAMPMINAPVLDEIIGTQTERGKEFFENLKKKHGVTKEGLKRAAGQLRKRTGGDFEGLCKEDLLLLGVEKGKFVFVPLMEMH